MSAFTPMGIQAVVKGLDKYLGDIKSMDSANQGAGRGLANFASAATGIAWVAIAAGAAAVASGFGLALKEAADSEEVFARLGAAITASGGLGPAMKDLGGWIDAGGGYMKKMDADGTFSYKLMTAGTAANYTLEQAKALSMSLRDLAGGSDEAVAAVIDMGVRMGTVAGEDMPAFVKGVFDIAAATGTDAVTAARNLAQSYDDPVGAMGRFARMGLKVNEATEAQIKELVKQGKGEEAAAVLTDALAKKSEGAAGLMAKTWKGQMAIMKNHILEGFETAGNSFLPFLEKANLGIMPVIDMIEGLGSKVATWITGMASLFQAAGLGAVLERILPPGIAQQVGGLIDTIMRLGGDVATTVGPFIDRFGTFISNLVVAGTPQILTNLQGALDGFATFWATSGPGIVTFADTVLRMAAITTMGAVTFLTGLADAVGRLLANDAGGFLDRLGGSLVTLAENMSGMDLGPGLAAWQGVWDNFKLIVTVGWEQTVTAITAIGANIVQGLITGIQSKLAALRKAAMAILDQLPAWAKKALGIGSPSKVFMEIGANITAGLAQGMQGPGAGLGRAMASVLAPAVAAPAFAMAGPVDNRQINMGGVSLASSMNMSVFDQMVRQWLGS